MSAIVTSSVVILALLASAHPPLALTATAERLELPAQAATARLESLPFQRSLAIEAGPSAQAVAQRLRGASRLCPTVELKGSTVLLRCKVGRLRATLVKSPGVTVIDLHSLTVPAWRPEEEGPPMVPIDTVKFDLGPCPGATPEARGECALAAGRYDEARAAFEEALTQDRSPLADLRLGDLALRADEPDLAVAHWRRASTEAPWGRLARARLCELDKHCMDSSELGAVFDVRLVDPRLRGDVAMRWARLRALEGDVIEAAQLLAPEYREGGGCQANLGWCRHILQEALQRPPPDGAAALAAWMSMPNRMSGPRWLELLRLAATQSERAGAPIFAANLLASSTARIPDAAQPAHLRRIAELYLAGGDRARAEEIVRFARTRLTVAEMDSPAWAAVRRATAPRPARPAPTDSPPDQDADVQAARAALEASRLAASQTGARP